MEGIKVGTVEVVKVRKTGRRLYINIDKTLADCYGIELGDTLRIRIEELFKGTEPEEVP